MIKSSSCPSKPLSKKTDRTLLWLFASTLYLRSRGRNSDQIDNINDKVQAASTLQLFALSSSKSVSQHDRFYDNAMYQVIHPIMGC